MKIDADIAKLPPPVGAATHHRFRFYPGTWSNFDGVEKCSKPGPCIGCEYKHPLCDDRGRVFEPTSK